MSKRVKFPIIFHSLTNWLPRATVGNQAQQKINFKNSQAIIQPYWVEYIKLGLKLQIAFYHRLTDWLLAGIPWGVFKVLRQFSILMEHLKHLRICLILAPQYAPHAPPVCPCMAPIHPMYTPSMPLYAPINPHMPPFPLFPPLPPFPPCMPPICPLYAPFPPFLSPSPLPPLPPPPFPPHWLSPLTSFQMLNSNQSQGSKTALHHVPKSIGIITQRLSRLWRAGNYEILYQWVWGNCISKFYTLLVQFFSNGTA